MAGLNESVNGDINDLLGDKLSVSLTAALLMAE